MLKKEGFFESNELFRINSVKIVYYLLIIKYIRKYIYKYYRCLEFLLPNHLVLRSKDILHIIYYLSSLIKRSVLKIMILWKEIFWVIELNMTKF